MASDRTSEPRILGPRKIQQILHHQLQPQHMIVDDVDAAAGGLVILDAGVFDGLDCARIDARGVRSSWEALVAKSVFICGGPGDLGDVAQDRSVPR